MKALSVRIDDRLSKEFDEVCRKTGYKKNTLLTRLIASFIQHQKARVKGRKGNEDPFLEVIGFMDLPPLESSDEIDKAVYGL